MVGCLWQVDWGIIYFGFWFCQGRYEIISLSGSFIFYENESQRNINSGLNVTLSSFSDGRVFGGRVAGVLIAATSLQVHLIL